MTLDEHIITIVGPKHEIDRFAEDFKLVSGAIDTDTGGIVRGWNQVPSMRAEPGWRYRVRKCRVGLCDIEIELDVQYPGLTQWSRSTAPGPRHIRAYGSSGGIGRRCPVLATLTKTVSTSFAR